MSSNRNPRYLAAFLLIFFLFYCTKVNAKGPPPPPPPVAAAVTPVQQQMQVSPACFWRLPGKIAVVNLYLVSRIAVYGEKAGEYRTRVYFANTYEDIELKMGVDVNFHILLAEQRLRQCMEGK